MNSGYCPRGPFCAFAHCDMEMMIGRYFLTNIQQQQDSPISNSGSNNLPGTFPPQVLDNNLICTNANYLALSSSSNLASSLSTQSSMIMNKNSSSTNRKSGNCCMDLIQQQISCPNDLADLSCALHNRCVLSGGGTSLGHHFGQHLVSGSNLMGKPLSNQLLNRGGPGQMINYSPKSTTGK